MMETNISGQLPDEAAVIDYLKSPPTLGRARILWLHNQPDHYFVDMLDALNAQGRAEYVGIFFSPPPVESVLTKLPACSKYLFLGAGEVQRGALWADRPMRPDAEAILAAAKFDMAIVGGYDYAIKRWVFNHCRERQTPLAIFADSNIHAELGGTVEMALKRLVKRARLRPIIRKLDRILCANGSGVKYWKYYGAAAGKTLVCAYYSEVLNAATLGGTDRAELLAICGIDTAKSQGKRLLFTAARLVPAKGLHLMVAAYRQLGLAAAGWMWVVVGTGPLEKELRQQAGELDGAGIHWVGVQPHDVVKGLAGQADAFVLPSIYEPHGIVVSEAMGAGTPVIASDTAGAAIDLVESGKTGWLFKNGDAADLARVLKEATENPEKLAAMRPSCRAKFEAWYGQYSPLVQVPKVVEELCQRKDGAVG